ncbi:MAG: hypothetical protein CL685_00565 [Candidatus Magasanikbacteria bacterium]|nr:hypothetical protein [Candidatus Magasanikbacteria bacterium]
MRLVKYKTIIAIIATVLFSTLAASSVFAAAGDTDDVCLPGNTCTLETDVCFNGICKVAAQVDVFGMDSIHGTTALGKADLQTTIARIINVALSLLGIVAVVIILLGGFKWMTAAGNDDKVEEAKKLILAGIIGLAIVMSAWAIARFVLIQLGQATDVTGATAYEL